MQLFCRLPVLLSIPSVVPGTRRVDAMLVADNFPELRTDLVAALATLNMDELAHGSEVRA